jgi:hypothetical protein
VLGKAYQQEHLAFERQKCTFRYKSSKECLTVMCCGNAPGNHKLKQVVTGKAKKRSSSRVPEHTAFMSIITDIKEHGLIERVLKTGSTSICSRGFGLSCVAPK